MSENDSGLIPLEDASGAPMDMPSEMVMPTKGAAPVTPPAEEPPAPVEPAAELDDDAALEAVEQELNTAVTGDPAKAGLLKSLQKTRSDLKATKALVTELRSSSEAGAAIAQRLIQRPDLVHLLETGQPIPAAEARALAATATVVSEKPVDTPQTVEDLTLLAQTTGLYKQDGSGDYDLEAARRVMSLIQRQTEQAVTQRVKPMEDRLLKSDAQAAMGEAMQAADSLGIDQDVAQRALSQLANENPALLRDPQIVATALFTAAGIVAVQRGSLRRAAALPPAEPAPRQLTNPTTPIVREHSTTAPSKTLEVSGALKGVMRSHGIAAASVEGTLKRLAGHDMSKNFSLEDEE